MLTALKTTKLAKITLHENEHNPHACFFTKNDTYHNEFLYVCVNNDYFEEVKNSDFYEALNEFATNDYDNSIFFDDDMLECLSTRSYTGFDIFCLSIIDTPTDVLIDIIRYVKNNKDIKEGKEKMTCTCDCKCNMTTKRKTEPQFISEDKSNDNEYTTYIILRNDLNRSVAEQMCDVVEVTQKMYGFSENIVILQANYDDLFVNNFIPTKFDNPDIQFVVLTNNEQKVAHGNFRLVDANITALGFYGIKKDIPKFVKKLKLYK